MSQAHEIEAVQRILTADLPALDAADRAAAWTRVSARSAASARRRVGRAGRGRPALRIAVPATVIAAALVVIVFNGSGSLPQVNGPVDVATADAHVILRRAADHLGAGRPLQGARARVIRESWLQLIVNRKGHEPPIAYVLPRTTESGFDALGGSFYEELPDGAPRFSSAAAKAAYIREFGPYVPIPPKPRVEGHLGPNQPDPNYLNLSAHQVLTLPTDPAALKARLSSQQSGLIAQDEPHDLVYLVSRLLTFGPTPPAVQAALARVLGTMPGVRRVGTAAIGGRRADILAFPSPHGVGMAQELAFDQQTGALLEEIDVLSARSPGYPGIAPGTVINAIAYSTAIAATLDTPVRLPAVTPADAPRATAVARPTTNPVPVPARPSSPASGNRTSCVSLQRGAADVFAYAVQGTAPNAKLLVRSAKVVCGGPDDIHMEPVGAKRAEPLAPGVKIELLVQGSRGPVLRHATLGQLTQLFAHSHDFQFEGYFSGEFRIHTNAKGQINAIAELYRP